MTAPPPVRLLVFCGATRWGGAEIVLGHLLEALPERFGVSLLGVDDTVLERIAARRPGTGWTTVPRMRTKRDLAAVVAHRRAMARARPDIVHLNLPVPFADPYTVLAAVTLRGTAVVAVEHLPAPCPWPRIDRLVRFAAPRLAAVVGVSAGSARQVEGLLGLSPGAARVVPNGVPEPAVRRPLPAPVPAGRLVVGAVGRFDRQKGFDVLLRAVADLPAVHVVLIGDGAERPTLERLVDDLGIRDRVSMPGWSEQASGYIRSFDVLVVPSRYEGLPLVVLEAMLAGVPVVATPVGGVPDAVRDGESGFLVPPDDAPALTAALARLAADPALRGRLAAAAEEHARREFTVGAMTRAYETLYDDVLGARRPRR